MSGTKLVAGGRLNVMDGKITVVAVTSGAGVTVDKGVVVTLLHAVNEITKIKAIIDKNRFFISSPNDYHMVTLI
jgi:hypothetical protein